MKRFKLELSDGISIKIEVALSSQERKKGLSGRDKLDSGMLFVFPYTGKHQMWMKGTNFPLDIVYINEDQEVLGIIKGKKEDTKLLGDFDDVRYVLELPLGTTEKFDILPDDILPIPDEFLKTDEESKSPSAILLDDKGEAQMNIRGGERVFSRPFTKKVIAKALDVSSDKDLEELGKMISDEINAQDTRDKEYVDSKSTKYKYS